MFVSASLYQDALFLLLGDNSERSRALVKELLDASDKQTGRQEITTADDDLVVVYKSLIKSVIAEKITQENTTAAKILLLKIKSNEVIKAHPVVRDVLTDVLSAQDPITSEQIDIYLRRIRNHLVYAEVDAASKKMFAKSRSISDIQDVEDQENEIQKLKTMLTESIKSIELRQQTSDNKASETYISMSDAESIRRAIDTHIDRNVRGVVRTGLQGLNRALGARGGMGLGETYVFCASSHNYKSGILISILIWSVIYNRIMVEPGKRAMVYFVSLENETHQNLMIVFKALFNRVEKRHVDLASMSIEFMVEWIQKYFRQFDVEVVIDRYTPHEFSFQRFLRRHNSFVDQGFQFTVFDLDYMSEARGIDPGDTFSTQGQIQLIKENYTKFANYAKQQGFLLTTGHQLTKKAEEIASQHRYAVKKFNPSMMADSSDVHRIVDGLFFMQLETNVEGHKFLTMVNRKNRGNMDTPEKDKFFAYPFTEFGIEDDLEGLPKFVTDIDAIDFGNTSANEALVEGSMF